MKSTHQENTGHNWQGLLRFCKLEAEMRRKTEQGQAGGGQLRLPAGVVLRPPVSVEDMRADTEDDPEGAEEFVALIRTLRRAGFRPIAF